LRGPANTATYLVGSMPPHFDPCLEGYKHWNILQMVFFYNESFGIEPDDDLKIRVMKFRRFLTEF
jgi:hypothetical protein